MCLIFWAQEQGDFSFTCYIKFRVFDCVTPPCLPPLPPSAPPAKLFEAALSNVFHRNLHGDVFVQFSLQFNTWDQNFAVLSGSGCTSSSYQFRDCFSLVAGSLCFPCLIFGLGGKSEQYARNDTASDNFNLIARSW